MNAKLRMILAGIFSLCLSGCIVPTPTVTTGPKGFKRDLSFIQIGSTTRQEIQERLGWADAHAQDSRLFLGHWRSSSAAMIGGGPGTRFWGGRSAMIEFDSVGRVQTYRVVKDGDLMEELATWMDRVRYPPLDLVHHVEVVGFLVYDGQQDRPARWDLTQKGIELYVGSQYFFLMTPKGVKSLRVRGEAENGRYRLGALDIDGDGMIKVVRYLQQTGNIRSTH